jgi:hypothetical protein
MKNFHIIIIILIILINIIKINTINERIDKIFERFNNINSPGISIGIIQNERFIYQKNFGMKSIESKIQIKNETKFGMASTSKQFTCLAIALLEEQGFFLYIINKKMGNYRLMMILKNIFLK